MFMGVPLIHGKTGNYKQETWCRTFFSWWLFITVYSYCVSLLNIVYLFHWQWLSSLFSSKLTGQWEEAPGVPCRSVEGKQRREWLSIIRRCTLDTRRLGCPSLRLHWLMVSLTLLYVYVYVCANEDTHTCIYVDYMLRRLWFYKCLDNVSLNR